MKYKTILSIDPSGNFHEGKGTTGLCILNASTNKIRMTKSISAKSYNTQEEYRDAILIFIAKAVKRYKSLVIVMEDYLLYKHKAETQINSKMETPKLIGVIQYYCWCNKIALSLQPAHMVKNRWCDEILEHKGYIKKRGGCFIVPDTKELIDRHAKDAIRHAVHFKNFKNKGE